eukprot:TRINITY_DN31060_c0_g1_i1.p1 TRINITY_DN31060_c0_g1~~TRINITY_DN31060_c0_g1_i1.p1  ORF type:complete len:127 (+),score=9.57 TRINITY_DN31060_c0_g1_i1:202-582(+)
MSRKLFKRNDGVDTLIFVIFAVTFIFVTIVSSVDRAVIGEEWELTAGLEKGPKFMRREHAWYNDPLGFHAQCERDFRYSLYEYVVGMERKLNPTDCPFEAMELAIAVASKEPWSKKSRGLQITPLP